MYPGRRIDPVQLLQQGAAVLQSRMPLSNASFKHNQEPYRARFDWPGVVTVSEDNTGEVLARSLPGRPFEPDTETKARAARMGAA